MNSRSIRVVRGSIRSRYASLWPAVSRTSSVTGSPRPVNVRSIRVGRLLVRVGRALHRLTWSFPPHSPAGAFAARSRRTGDSHPLSPEDEAGLTSKPRHARRPRVALRGSFRPRLASTTGGRPRATTDPDEGPVEYRQVDGCAGASVQPPAARRATLPGRAGSRRTRQRSLRW